MKKLVKTLAVCAVLAGTMSGCSYGGVAVVGDKVVVAKNNGFLFGILNSIYVCKLGDNGLHGCAAGEAP